MQLSPAIVHTGFTPSHRRILASPADEKYKYLIPPEHTRPCDIKKQKSPQLRGLSGFLYISGAWS